MTTPASVQAGTPVAPNGWLPNGGTVSQLFNVWEYLPQLGINAPHHGIDIAGKRGDPVMVPEHAVVQNAGFDSFGGGNFVQLLLDSGNTVDLYHLMDVNVKTGQDLAPNTLAGHLDSTGASTGDHLHFQVNNAGGTPVDPWTWLTEAVTPAPAVGSGGGFNWGEYLMNPTKYIVDHGTQLAPGSILDPKMWWKAGFIAIGVAFIGVGIIVYFFAEEKAVVVKVEGQAQQAGSIAAVAA